MNIDNQPILIEEELFQILCDYSDDLGKLKKRDGKLPAHAAVARIQSLIQTHTRLARIDEVSRALSQPRKTWQPVGGISNIQWQETDYFNQRLAQLKSKEGEDNE